MTPQEIHQRLNKEFPDRYVTLNLSVTNELFSEDGSPISPELYDSDLGPFPCSNLEDGIKHLKLRLGTVQPEIEITI